MNARNPCASSSREGPFAATTSVTLHICACLAPFLALGASAVGTFTSAISLDLSECFLPPANTENPRSGFFNLRRVQQIKVLDELGKSVLMQFRLLSESQILLSTYARNEEGQHDLRTLVNTQAIRSNTFCPICRLIDDCPPPSTSAHMICPVGR